MQRRSWYLLMNSLVAAWLIAAGVAVVVHRFVPHPLWLMVHLAVLGAASTAILIWSQHFSDTLLRHQAVGGRRMLGARLLGHTVGSVLVVVGIMTEVWPIVLVGGLLVGLTAAVHAGVLFTQLRTALPSRFGPLVRYYVAAALLFVVGIGLGVWMAAATDPVLYEQLLAAHSIVNVFGWIGLTVVGTAVLLWPTVLHTQIGPAADAAARRALPLMLIGLASAVLGCFAGAPPLVGLGLLIWFAALCMLIWHGSLQARKAPPVNYAGWSLGAGILWLAIAIAIYAVQSMLAPTVGEVVGALQYVVPLLVVGFVMQVLLGALSYLLPVVIGGGPASARAAAAELDRGSAFRAVAINGGIVLYLLPVPSLVKVLLSGLIVGALVSAVVLGFRAVTAAARVRQGGTAPGGPNAPKAPRAASGATSDPRSLPAVPMPVRSRSGMVVAAVGALVLAVAGGVALDPAAAGIGVAASQSGVQESGITTTVTVGVEGMRFTPDLIEVPIGNRLVINFENTGTDVHDLTVANGVTSGKLMPGESATVDVGVIGAALDGWCSVAGHRQMGMVFTIVPTGGADATGSGATPDGMAGMGPGNMDHGNAAGAASAADDLDLAKTPAAGFEPWNALLEPAGTETVHAVTFTVSELQQDVAPGVNQTLWTFGGAAPGPVLRGHVGDRFDITLVNDGTIGHSIDFHAGELAPNQPMRTIQSGESLIYSFTATRAGIWMYHCATAPMSSHIANGMFGAVIIDPPGLAPVASEYLLVQSEFYLGPQGGEVDATKIAAERPDLVVFNGYAMQYRDVPLTARVGERIRVWVLDVGPNRATSFHVIGGQFDTVWKEGDYTLKNGGSTGVGGSQALDLMPAQGGFVELAFPEAGDYPFVSHVMIDAERGATGVFHVTE